MKKFFTSMAIAAMTLCSASVNAEEITLSISGYKWDYNAEKELASYDTSVTTELVNNGDGSYTFPNFMNSGYPVTFKFNKRNADNEGSEVEITSKTDIYGEGYEDYPYLLSPEGDALELSFTSQDNQVVDLYDPYITVGSGEYGAIVYGYPEGPNWRYWAYMSLTGYDAADNDVYLDLEFFFDKYSDSAVNEISVDNNAPVEYYNMSGVRVENPSNGLFIRRQGGDVKKVMIK